MRRTIASRAAWTVLLLLAVSLVSFLLLELSPGSVFDRERLDPRSSPAIVAELASRYGLDRPWYVQYGSWLWGVLRLDLGYSIRYQRSVAGLLAERLPETLALTLTAHVASLLLAFVLGLFVAKRRGGAVDAALRAIAVAVLSIHPVVLALLAMLVAAATGLTPIGGGSSIELGTTTLLAELIDGARHLLLPAAVLTLVMLPAIALQARTAFLEALASPPVRAARSRGVAERAILWRHAAPLAALPIVSFWGASFGRLLSASFLIEVATSWPGLGPLTLEALAARDPFLLLGVLFVAAVLVSLFNLANDLLLAGVDPRVRLEETVA